MHGFYDEMTAMTFYLFMFWGKNGRSMFCGLCIDTLVVVYPCIYVIFFPFIHVSIALFSNTVHAGFFPHQILGLMLD